MTEGMINLQVMAEGLYRDTTQELDGMEIINHISIPSLFGVRDFIKGNRQIVVTRAAPTIAARPYERNQLLIPDTASAEQFTVCTGKAAYILRKLDRETLIDVMNDPVKMRWLLDLLENMGHGVSRGNFLPELISVIMNESSPRTKGSQAGSIIGKFDMGTVTAPRIIDLSKPSGPTSMAGFVLEIQEMLDNLNQWRSGEMYILGAHQIKLKMIANALNSISANVLSETAIMSSAGKDIGNKLLAFDFIHDPIMRPRHLTNSNQVIYPLIFGHRKATAFAGETESLLIQDNGPTDTSRYIQGLYRYGGRVMTPDAVGVAYIAFQQ
jgi:hypothetical protein